jgi:hypothetical protein
VDPLPELHIWEINLESGEVYRPMSFAEGDGKGAYKKMEEKENNFKGKWKEKF